MRAGLVRFVLVPLGLASLFLWPLFVKPYHLGGGVAVELMMASSLKAAFNRALLHGQFPLWNDWVQAGKVFLTFGAVPLHPYTVLELLFDPALGERFVAIEILINYILVAALMLATCRYLGIPGWTGCLGFLVYILFDPVPVLSHIPWWWAGAFVAAPFMILIVMLHPTHPPRRLRLTYLALALFFVTGTKPEVFYMFLIYVTLLAVILAIRGSHALRFLLPSLACYVVLPVAFYAWQIPLVGSLLATSTARFRGSPESLSGMVENVYLSLLTSNALRVGLVSVGYVLLIRFVLAPGLKLRRHTGPTHSRAHYVPLATGLCLALLTLALGVRYLVPHMTALGGIAALFVLWAIIGVRLGAEVVSDPMAALSLQSLWRLPLLMAGTHSAIFETYGVTPTRPLPTVCGAAFLFFLMVGGLFRPPVAPACATPNDRLSTLSDSLILALGLGWVIRDFLALPLFDVFNFMWVNPRDVFWYAPCPVFLAMIGLARFAHVLQGCGLHSESMTDRFCISLQYGAAALALGITILGFHESIVRFYVRPGQAVDNAVWEHFMNDQASLRQHRVETYRSQYYAARDQVGGFVRGITHSNNDLGLAGAGARYGVVDAWAWDFVADSYRRLIARAYRVNEEVPRHLWPRLWNNSVAALRVYGLRYPGASIPNLVRTYWRQIVMQTSSHPDPFYLELLRVGIIWNYAQPKLEQHPRISTLSADPLLTYRVHPSRSLQRWGILPDGDAGPQERARLLRSERTDELERVYRDVTFFSAELLTHGFAVREATFRPNHHRFVITAVSAGYLVVFDSWHPDWHASINGRAEPLSRVFLNFRAVRLAPGLNRVEFVYRPAHFGLAVAVSILGILLGVGWAVDPRRAITRLSGVHPTGLPSTEAANSVLGRPASPPYPGSRAGIACDWGPTARVRPRKRARMPRSSPP